MSNRNSKEERKPQKRVVYSGNYVRVSRTDGVAVTKICKKDGAGATLNTKQGLRLHTRLCQGARTGLQNRIFQCIGSYHNGPFNCNISKSGVSNALQNKKRSYNLFKPNDASFKFGGIELRGKNAATFQLLYLFVMLCVHRINFFLEHCLFCFLVWIFNFKTFGSFNIGFFKGFKAASM